MKHRAQNEKPKPDGRAAKSPLIHQGSLYAWPMGIWLIIFFVAPLIIILVYSFLKKDIYGTVLPQFTLKAYKDMCNPKYAVIVLRTLKISIIATAITIAIALPCGYAIARSKHQTLLLLLVIIPFWTNSLFRMDKHSQQRRNYKSDSDEAAHNKTASFASEQSGGGHSRFGIYVYSVRDSSDFYRNRPVRLLAA